MRGARERGFVPPISRERARGKNREKIGKAEKRGDRNTGERIPVTVATKRSEGAQGGEPGSSERPESVHRV